VAASLFGCYPEGERQRRPHSILPADPTARHPVRPAGAGPESVGDRGAACAS